jgi:hypothetical protein
VEVDGQPFETAREAAIAFYGKKTGGWWFFLADPTSGRTLSDGRLTTSHQHPDLGFDDLMEATVDHCPGVPKTSSGPRR